MGGFLGSILQLIVQYLITSLSVHLFKMGVKLGYCSGPISFLVCFFDLEGCTAIHIYIHFFLRAYMLH